MKIDHENRSFHLENSLEFKYSLLRGQLGILMAIVCLIYVFIDLFNGIYVYIPWYIGGLVVALFVIYQNRKRNYTLSSSALLIVTNLLVFVIAASNTPGRGVFFFFIATAVCGLVLFHYSDQRLGWLFVAFSIGLALLAYFGDWAMYKPQITSDKLVKVNFTFNFLLGLLSSVLVVYFVIKRNSESERSLLANQKKLEKINEELDRFVYSASHDMRAPLSTLTGVLDLARLNKDPADYPEIFDMMTDRISAMELFIKEVTDYSRNTRLEVSTDQVHIKSLVEQTVQSFEFLSNKAGVTVEVNVDEDINIITDANRLAVVLNNLIANAIKYHAPWKDIRTVKVKAMVDDSICTICISDNGIGISPEYHDKIFDMFFRASEKAEGSGLGLYIVKETLQRINGSITYQSELEKGSDFEIKIPVDHAGIT